MNRNRLTALSLTVAAVLLAACNGTAETSVVAGASDAPAASVPAASAGQEVKTADGAVTLTLPADFADQTARAEELVGGVAKEDLLLLQRSEAQDTTVYVVKAGAPKQPAEAYFAKLAETVKAAEGLENVVVDAAQGNRLAYRFSRSENGSSLNESCTVLYGEKEIYTVCAAGAAAAAELDALPAAAVLGAQ